MTNHPAFQQTEEDREVLRRVRREVEAAASRVANALLDGTRLSRPTPILAAHLDDAYEALVSATRFLKRRLGEEVS